MFGCSNLVKGAAGVMLCYPVLRSFGPAHKVMKPVGGCFMLMASFALAGQGLAFIRSAAPCPSFIPDGLASRVRLFWASPTVGSVVQKFSETGESIGRAFATVEEKITGMLSPRERSLLSSPVTKMMLIGFAVFRLGR